MILKLLLLTLLLEAAFPAGANPHPGERDTPQLDLNGYSAELRRWSAAARRLPEHPQEAATLRKKLPAYWLVRVDGQHFVVSTRWFDSVLKSVEEEPHSASEQAGQMLARLQAMQTEAEALRSASSPSPATAREKLDAILQRPEFHSVRGPTWFEQFRQRVAEWLADLTEALLSRLRYYPNLTSGVFWAAVAALLLLFLGWLVGPYWRRRFGLTLGRRAPAPLSKTWQAWMRDARAAAQCRSYREALRLAYWAALYRLAELGMWKLDRARTHREYLRLLSESHPQRDQLASLTARFEHVWYGGQEASANDFQSALTQLERLGCPSPWNPATGKS